ncbi:hypothetical protein OTK49_02015 [Vibrio coralliirubri]|uniref:hypothetical protein n=1 Tax=Vibrio coralliirubri TaxID=1516159 RepID=UPI0022842229|nr:hypothetical protein [Vibrio coralliirubri]MCY9861290.1 hypothetical protein [Vibrio coralliirubri]
MCTLSCKNCNKNNIYLGTSVQNFESLSENNEFEGIVFTDCIVKARQDAYEKTTLGKEGIVVAHEKGLVGQFDLEEISDDEYGFHIFMAGSSAKFINFVAV